MLRARRRTTLAVALAGLVAASSLTACSYTTEVELPTADPQTSRVLWDDGTTLTTLHAEQNREDIPLAAMGATLPTAVVAIEDARYFDHKGVDPRGILRALTRDVQAGRAVEGGSTITQQYVRAVLLTPERNLQRKIKEAVLAVQLERQYSKRTILERYLNLIYFGNGAYGVQAAAQTYFGRDARDLDLPQSAMLAGIIRAPGDYDPYERPEAALARRNEVLTRMAELERADRAEVTAALATPLGVVPEPTDDRNAAPHFIDRVREFIVTTEAFGPTRAARERLLYEGGLRIETTLDPRAQADAIAAVQRTLVRPGTDPAAAVVAMDPRTGHVLAYVGGSDYYGGQAWARYDLAGQGSRSAGSTFKPFVLAAALEDGIPMTRDYAAPGELAIPIRGQAPWVVRNYDGQGSGRMDLAEATVRSVNTVYAQLIMDVGAQPVVDLAARMGVRSTLGAFPSAALGTNGVTVLDMASSYATLAADGSHIDPVLVTRVSDSTGRVLWRARPERTRVLPPRTSREVTAVLEEVVERGTAVNAKIGRPVAGKTGTGEEWSDAWFVGYTPEFVAAVWVGFPDAARTMRPPTTRITVTGGSWPSQIFQGLAGAYLAETPASDFPSPVPPDPEPGAPTGPTGPGLASVIGLEVDTASRLLVDAGLRIRIVEAASRGVAAGRVISQSPNARYLVRPGDLVTLTVSTGPPVVVTVPSVLGLSAAQAVAALADAGFQAQLRLEAEPPPGDPARVGRVWKQLPSGGTTQAVDEAVVVWVNP